MIDVTQSSMDPKTFSTIFNYHFPTTTMLKLRGAQPIPLQNVVVFKTEIIMEGDEDGESGILPDCTAVWAQHIHRTFWFNVHPRLTHRDHFEWFAMVHGQNNYLKNTTNCTIGPSESTGTCSICFPTNFIDIATSRMMPQQSHMRIYTNESTLS